MDREKVVADKSMNKNLSEKIFKEHTSQINNPNLLLCRSWVIHRIEYPIIDLSFTQEGKKTLRLRLNCEGWNETPPSIELLDCDGNLLAVLPQGHGVFNGSSHPKTHKPFICMIGSREYHEHDSHLADLWENNKERSSLGVIITQIWNAWKKTT